MKELSIDSLMGSLVNYGSDPLLVETEEQAQELFDSMDDLYLITDKDEVETAKKQLNLERYNVTKVYGFMCDGCASVVCFGDDW